MQINSSHDPDNLGNPGKGWRFITKEEQANGNTFERAEYWSYDSNCWKPKLSKTFWFSTSYRVPAETAPPPSRWPDWDRLCYQTK